MDSIIANNALLSADGQHHREQRCGSRRARSISTPGSGSAQDNNVVHGLGQGQGHRSGNNNVGHASAAVGSGNNNVRLGRFGALSLSRPVDGDAQSQNKNHAQNLNLPALPQLPTPAPAQGSRGNEMQKIFCTGLTQVQQAVQSAQVQQQEQPQQQVGAQHFHIGAPCNHTAPTYILSGAGAREQLGNDALHPPGAGSGAGSGRAAGAGSQQYSSENYCILLPSRSATDAAVSQRKGGCPTVIEQRNGGGLTVIEQAIARAREDGNSHSHSNSNRVTPVAPVGAGLVLTNSGDGPRP